MPYLRAPYYRRTQNRLDTVEGLPDLGEGGDLVTDALAGVSSSVTVGALTAFYDDKTPSNLTLSMNQEVTVSNDGIVNLEWVSNVGADHQTRILRKSGNTWFVQGQVTATTSKFSVSGFTVAFINATLGIQSVKTLETFTSQITYDTVFISGSIH